MTSPSLFPGVEDTRRPARVSTFGGESAPSPKSPKSPQNSISLNKWVSMELYQTHEEDFKCMGSDGEGAGIYGTQSYNGESPTSDDVFQHVKGCKEKG